MAVGFGRRIRKGAAGTAVAALAMAALSASQAPGLALGADHSVSSPDVPPGSTQIDGGSPNYYTALPPLAPSSPPGAPKVSDPGLPAEGGPSTAGIPATVLAAYRNAETILSHTRPGCHLPWQLLAAIGQVESSQARNGDVDSAGTTLKKILGPVLDGNGFADITDTDGGRWDDDTVHDRAVGPMQFIPSTWNTWGADGNKDGVKDPDNVFDAALAAGDYLCAVGGDLSQQANINRAILGYNHSDAYLRTVLSWFEFFRKGVHEVPDGPLGTGVVAHEPDTTSGGTPTPSGSPTPTPSASPSRSPHPSPSASPSASGSPTTTPSPSASATGPSKPPATGTPSGSPSTSASGSPTPSTSPTGCPTPTGTPTATPIPTPTGSASPSPGDTCSPSPSASPTGSASPSVRPSVSPSASPSVSPSGATPAAG